MLFLRHVCIRSRMFHLLVNSNTDNYPTIKWWGKVLTTEFQNQL